VLAHLIFGFVELNILTGVGVKENPPHPPDPRLVARVTNETRPHPRLAACVANKRRGAQRLRCCGDVGLKSSSSSESGDVGLKSSSSSESGDVGLKSSSSSESCRAYLVCTPQLPLSLFSVSLTAMNEVYFDVIPTLDLDMYDKQKMIVFMRFM
jgi:hypothetical protein